MSQMRFPQVLQNRRLRFFLMGLLGLLGLLKFLGFCKKKIEPSLKKLFLFKVSDSFTAIPDFNYRRGTRAFTLAEHLPL